MPKFRIRPIWTGWGYGGWIAIGCPSGPAPRWGLGRSSSPLDSDDHPCPSGGTASLPPVTIAWSSTIRGSAARRPTRAGPPRTCVHPTRSCCIAQSAAAALVDTPIFA
jgi:hypothetical protein